MLTNWKWSHTVISIVVALMGALQALAMHDHSLDVYVQPAMLILTLVLGVFGVGSPKGVAIAPSDATVAKMAAESKMFPDDPKPRGFIRGDALVPILAACALIGMVRCSWLSSPQGAAAVTAAVDVAICVLNHSQEPVQQIVTDCGAATASDVIKILDAHHAATVRERSAQ